MIFMIHMYIIVVNQQMGDFFFPSIKVYIINIHLVASSRTHLIARSIHTTSSTNRNITSGTNRNPTVGTYRNPNCGGTRQSSTGRCRTSWNPPGTCGTTRNSPVEHSTHNGVAQYRSCRLRSEGTIGGVWITVRIYVYVRITCVSRVLS